MKKVTKKSLAIVPPSKESGLYETDTFMPKMHTVTICIGKRASGKSVAIVNLIEKMKFDYSIVVSPTISSNKELMDRLNVEHVFEDVDDISAIDQIKQIVVDEAEDLVRYQNEMERYKKLMSDLKKGVVVQDNELLEFYGEDQFEPPKHRWNGRKPRIACFLDDCLGSMIYSKPRKLNALATYSRHIGQMPEGGSIGISLFFAIQSFKCKTGGLTPTIKNQCTNIILFKTKDAKELKDIAESVGGEVDEDIFMKVYDKAIGDGKNHEFLFIDLHKKKEHPSCFRQRFDTFIIPEELNKNNNIDNNNKDA
jgi:hypothetical protein